MRITQVTLQAPLGQIEELAHFYTHGLGLAGLSGSLGDEQPERVSIRIGWSQLTFGAAAAGESPFYHFALLVPADRMEEVLEWAIVTKRLGLLAFSDDPADLVIDFENWRAHSCYFHDPVGNIVELIAHESLPGDGSTGAFAATELLGISEIGLIGEPHRVAGALLADPLLSLFDGHLEALAFVGEPTAALILAETGWPWLPQGRQAEPWPVAVTIEGGGEARIVTTDLHRVTCAPEQR